MPQLDKVTFLSQFFWLTFFFLGFYFVLLKYFLPKMSRILKFRKKKMEFSKEGFSLVGGEKEKVEKSYHTLVGNGLSLPRSLLSSNVNKIEEWVKSTLSSLNKSQFVGSNKKYITTVGSKAVSDKFALLPIYTQSSQTNTNSFLFSFFTPEKIKDFVSGIGKNSNRSFGKKGGEGKGGGEVTVKGKEIKNTKSSTPKDKKVGEGKQSSLKEGKVEESKESALKGKKGKVVAPHEKGIQKLGKKDQRKTDS